MCIRDRFIDESHITVPQIRGMYNGDRARKESLVENGFRLKAALDNRPLRFEEFREKSNQTVFISATPGDFELEVSDNHIAEQLILSLIHICYKFNFFFLI